MGEAARPFSSLLIISTFVKNLTIFMFYIVRVWGLTRDEIFFKIWQIDFYTLWFTFLERDAADNIGKMGKMRSL